MNNFYEDDYRNMLNRFRLSDLKALLEAFGRNKVGQRTELREQALELLTSRPIGLNYVAYLSKIYEIYHLMPCSQSDFSNYNMMCPSMQTQQSQMMSMSQIHIPQQEMYQPPQYHQQSMHMPQARLPYLMTKMEGSVYGNSTGANTIYGNTMANNYTQYGSGCYQPVGPQVIVPSPRPYQMPSNLQNMHTMIQNKLKLALKPSTGGNNNALISSPQIVVNYKFKKLPFYDVVEEIIKPTLLDGSERCTLSNFAEGMRECTFEHTMSNEQISLIALNRDTSYGKTEYDFQYQIRICQLENYMCEEVTDYFPIGLQIRVGKHNCTLPPTIPRAQSGTMSRRIARPINIAQFLQLCPFIKNLITVNWIPDGKKYALGMFIVKQLNVDTLIKKLLDKKVRSSEETKNYIIKKLTDVDPDLTATSSYNCSLMCPLSKIRMKIPAKSIHCDHIQCFDAGTFISINEKKSKWMCPTCNKPCLYDDMQIENYFLEIVTSPTLQDDINEIEILADGSWIIPGKKKDTKNVNSTIDNKIKSIDFIELDDIDDEKCVNSREEFGPEGSECQESENLKPHHVDLTMDEDEEPSKKKN